jgi:ABC-type amino acid transport substrate-binding protein
LSDISPGGIALLRTFGDSPFSQQFPDVGLKIYTVENIEHGMRLVRNGRVDYSLADDDLLARNDNAEQLEFSTTLLDSVQVGIFVNLNCQYANQLIQHSEEALARAEQELSASQ